MTTVADIPMGHAQSGFLIRNVGRILWIFKFIAGVLLCLTPVTAVFALGWLSRLTRREITLRLDPATIQHWPNWIRLEASSSPQSWASNLLGALWRNLKSGVSAISAIAIISAPYCALWLFSWYAGWDNSFNKGYEQAHIGPILGLTGVALATVIWTYLPFALAHQAAEERWQAFFEFRKVGQLIRMSGWGLIAITLIYFILIGFVMLVKMSPVFMEKIYPPFLTYSPEQITKFINGYFFWATVLLFAGLIVHRWVLGRVYAFAARRCVHYYPEQWRDTYAGKLLGDSQVVPGRPSFIGASLRLIVMVLSWPGLAFLIFVGQFFNYNWLIWIQHPVFQLPWIAR